MLIFRVSDEYMEVHFNIYIPWGMVDIFHDKN